MLVKYWVAKLSDYELKLVISINIKKNYFDFDKMNLSVSSKFRQNVTLKKIIFDGLSVLVKY